MPVAADEIAALIDTELAALADPEVEKRVRAGLVQPRRITLDWDYGRPGQQFDGWVVFDHEAGSNTLIVYCEEGFGPKHPWGLVFACAVPAMGMDSGWFPTFLQAFGDSFAALPLSQPRPI